MLKKTIKYTDYDGNEREEDFYFNISKAELARMESSVLGGFKKYLEKITQAQDNVSIMKTFKELVHMSYGEKSADGRRFIKSEELSTSFEQTEAYSELIIELLSDDGVAAAKFVQGILPKDVLDAAELGLDKSNIKMLPNS